MTHKVTYVQGRPEDVTTELETLLNDGWRLIDISILPTGATLAYLVRSV